MQVDSAVDAASGRRMWLCGAGAVVGTVAMRRVRPTAVNGDPTVDVVTQVLPWRSGRRVRAHPRARPAALPDRHRVPARAVHRPVPLRRRGDPAQRQRLRPLGAVARPGLPHRVPHEVRAHTGTWSTTRTRTCPSFYPPLFFWVLGRLERAARRRRRGRCSKSALLAVAFLVPTAGWLLWRPIVGPAGPRSSW